MKYELIIFDLDGTLLNTLEDLAAATNLALAENGFPARSTEEVRRFVGNGAARLIQRALPEDASPQTCDKVLGDFKQIYARDVNNHTRPYDGICLLLNALRQAGIHAAVNSNKPDAATQALCKAHFDGLLSMALGEREGIPKKPAPDGVDRIISALGANRKHTLYVGDGDTDLMTASNAGIDGAWVSWGFRRREELEGPSIPLSFDTADALRKFILG